MGGSMRGIPEGAWQLRSNTIDNNNKWSLNNDINNALEYLKETTNNSNN